LPIHLPQGDISIFRKVNPRGIQLLPDTFADFVAGDDRRCTLHLREAACSYYR
jgi:hypothetical protein